MSTHARVKPAGAIDQWAGWPKDVVGKLLGWNKGPNAPLSFRRIGLFECLGCSELCQSHKYGAAVLSGKPLCDDCLVAYARGQLALATVSLRAVWWGRDNMRDADLDFGRRLAQGAAISAMNTAASMRRRGYISVEERRHHIALVEGFALDFRRLEAILAGVGTEAAQ